MYGLMSPEMTAARMPRGGARVSTAPQEIARLAERVSGQLTRPVMCHDGLLAHYQSCSLKRAAKRG